MESDKKSQETKPKNLSEEDLGKIIEKIGKGVVLLSDFEKLLGDDKISYKLTPGDTAKVLAKFSEQKLDILVLIIIMQWYGEYIKDNEESKKFINTLIKNNAQIFIENFELFTPIIWSFEAFKKIIQETQDVSILRTAISSIKKIEEKIKKNPDKIKEIQKDELLVILSGKIKRWGLTKELVWNFWEKQLAVESDPAFKIFQKINDKHFKSVLASEAHLDSEIDKNRWKIMVARNIYFQTAKEVPEWDISELMVEKELKNIIKTRWDMAKDPLFKWRNILYVANAETDKNGIPTTRRKWNKNNKWGNYIFGKSAVINAIKDQWGVVRLKRSENENKITAESNKKKILFEMETMPPPLTFLFDGHAIWNRLYLTWWGDSPLTEESMVYISVEEMLESYKKRWEKYRGWKDIKQDYFIFDCCYGHDFIRNFYQWLTKNEDIRKPIMISSAEYSQEALVMDNKYWSVFMEKTLNLGEKWITTFQTIFDGDNAAEGWVNPSVFVPIDDNINHQISAIEWSKKEENIIA